MSACACCGSLQDGPTRQVVHGRDECTSTPDDGSEPVRIAELGRCPRCADLRAFVASHGGTLCTCCPHAAAQPKETPR